MADARESLIAAWPEIHALMRIKSIAELNLQLIAEVEPDDGEYRRRARTMLATATAEWALIAFPEPAPAAGPSIVPCAEGQ